MHLRLIRHAEPAYVADGLQHNDPPLTERGRRQAEVLATRDWGRVDELWVSPMVRARQTAEPLADALGLEPIVRDWMHEIQAPDGWDGQPADEYAEFFRTANLRELEDLWEGMPDGGEAFRDFHARVVDGLTATLAGYGAEPVVTEAGHPDLWSTPDDVHVVFVAHGGTNAVTLGHLLGLTPTPWEWDRFDSAHTSIATLHSRPIAHAAAFCMQGFGDVGHLVGAGEDVTR